MVKFPKKLIIIILFGERKGLDKEKGSTKLEQAHDAYLICR
jgi:hypothetical protein